MVWLLALVALAALAIYGLNGRRLTDTERDRYARFEEFARNVPGVLYQFRIDPQGTMGFPFVSERIESLTGCTAGAVMADAEVIFSRIHGDDRAAVFKAIEDSKEALETFAVTFRLEHVEHGIRWLEASSTPSRSDDGTLTWHGYLEDVTEERATQDRLEQADKVFEVMREGILIADESHRIVRINPALERMLGYSSEELRGKTPAMLYSSRDRDAAYQDILNALDAGAGRWQGDVQMQRRDGSAIDIDCFVARIRNEAMGTVRHISVLHDISERLSYQQRLERLASFDVLTGLPNRRLLSDRLDQAIAQSQRTGEVFAVCMLDLDDFKPVNDRFGHEAGDQVLKAVGERLGDTLRGEDTVARVGGDEFVIVIRHYKRDPVVFDRILNALAGPIELDASQATVEVRGSLGVSLFEPTTPLNGDQLLRQADQAAYRVKSRGGHDYRFFSGPDTE
ncbi:hypothetical protein BA899_01360 [Spiribacter sp. SSL99]|uniref:diguanylate cyclase domain-containing protein n=1 Tax=Spiribacter sp. SSL99 TaxID=1866884 RepID=UPI00132FF88F|nr:diguanylate cyclase [Spiribacter sp. SSL99]KAF0285849.1 hypothetical protein BA899_01360 [Spiribacter sp. SSL99]